jgi:hypothetical protein
LQTLNLPKISPLQKKICDTEITIEDLYESVSSMAGGKSPGNDGLGKEFTFNFGMKSKIRVLKVYCMEKKLNAYLPRKYSQ